MTGGEDKYLATMDASGVKDAYAMIRREIAQTDATLARSGFGGGSRRTYRGFDVDKLRVLRDIAAVRLADVNASVQRMSEDLADAALHGGALARGLDRIGKMGVAIAAGTGGGIGKALAEAAKDGGDARAVMDDLGRSTHKFLADIGRELAPALKGVASVISALGTVRRVISDAYAMGLKVLTLQDPREVKKVNEELKKQAAIEKEMRIDRGDAAESRRRALVGATVAGDAMGVRLAEIRIELDREKQRIAEADISQGEKLLSLSQALAAAEEKRLAVFRDSGTVAMMERQNALLDRFVEGNEYAAALYERQRDAEDKLIEDFKAANEEDGRRAELERDHERYIAARRAELGDASRELGIAELRNKGLQRQADLEELSLRYERERRQAAEDTNLSMDERAEIVSEINAQEERARRIRADTARGGPGSFPSSSLNANFDTSGAYAFLARGVFGSGAPDTGKLLDQQVKQSTRMVEILGRIETKVGGATRLG